MTAYEYILRKNAHRKNKQIILNRLEARIFGIKYPLEKGWIQKTKSLELSQSMLDEVTSKLPEYIENQKLKSDARKNKKNPKEVITKALFKGNTLYIKTIDANAPEFLFSYAWRVLRLKIIKKYGAVCQCCGASPSTGAVINVDHIKPRKFYPELALDENNLQVLCHDCNHGKGNWDSTDWRPSKDSSYDPAEEFLERIKNM